jgi:threonine dehydrogenase-like Zn-dependent dehydrogenase
MRAAVLRSGQMVLRDDVPDPVPGAGQVLVRVHACGICGSDLHFARHGPTVVALGDEMRGVPETGEPRLDLDRDVFMGHEVAAEVLEAGPGTDAPDPGTVVTSIPVLLAPTGIRQLTYTNDLPAGYSERMLLSAPLLLPVPNGLDARAAALTEPLAVGLHAVNRAGIEPGTGALVLGSGPVGLAVIAALAERGVEPVVAADLSPARRDAAQAMGAHEAVDPEVEAAFEAWGRIGGGRPLVVFEAIGVPGILDEVLREAPPRTRVVVVGACMERDTVTPMFGLVKELDLRFSFAYDLAEFGTTLRWLAEGVIDPTPLVTGQVDLDGVPGAFDDLADPGHHCKIVVVPA